MNFTVPQKVACGSMIHLSDLHVSFIQIKDLFFRDETMEAGGWRLSPKAAA